MPRMTNFFISKNLDKAEKMPNYRQWHVAESDRSVEGQLLLYIRAKGRFFDRVGQLRGRHCVLTKRNFLLIYMDDEKGFVLDLQRAIEIQALADNVSVVRIKYCRCRIKIRYPFGTVNITLTNDKIDLWRNRLLDAGRAPTTTYRLFGPPPSVNPALTPVRPASSTYRPLDNVEMSPSLVALESFCYSDKEDSKRENNNWANVKTPARQLSQESVITAVDVSTRDDDYQSSRLQQIEEEEDTQSASEIAETCMSGLFNYDSVRESDVPVGWLRRQLEHKITADRRRPDLVAPPTTPAAEEAVTVTSSNITVTSSDVMVTSPTLSKAAEPLPMPRNAVLVTTTVTTASKSTKQAKFASRRKSPKKSSRDNARFNSFQFWRSSVFESDV